MKYFPYFLIGVVAVAISVVLVAGTRGTKFQKPPIEIIPDMDHQAKIKAQSPNPFFADESGSRVPVPGTVPTVEPVDQEYFYTGKIGAAWGDGIPVEVTPALLARGRERFAINCQTCHGASAQGNGIAAKLGFSAIANLQADNFRAMSDGEIFNTIRNGKGQMNGLGANLPPADRWAVVAYLRALQRSQHAAVTDVPEADRAGLEKP